MERQTSTGLAEQSSRLGAAMAAKRAADRQAFAYIDGLLAERGEVKAVLDEDDRRKVEEEQDPGRRAALYNSFVRLDGHVAECREGDDITSVFITSVRHDDELGMTVVSGFRAKTGEEVTFPADAVENADSVISYLSDMLNR